MNVKSKKKEEDNEFTNVKCKLKKYMIKYMERVVFSVGALLIIWFVLEKIGVIKLISWLVDEDIQTFVYDIKDASGDSNFNLLDDHLVEKLNLYNVDSFYKFKIPISIDKNQFLNTCIQYSMVLSCYACITYIQSYFQSFKLLNNNNAADNSDMISRIKLKINNIIKRNNSGNQLKQQQQQQHQQVEKEEQSNTSKNNNSNTTNNNNSSISYFIYVESTIDQLLETPFTFLMIILLFSWILFRLYLENVPIHSLTGKWSIDQQISPIYFISFSTLLASIILLSFYILFLKYSFDNINNIIDNRKKLNKNRNSNNSNSNNNKKKNKKEKTTIDKKENHQGQEKINNQGDGDNNSDDDNLNIKN
ncbi:hypothetical protein CYY_005052 [Polysphondylium violaceum]|uniref:Uncharacterized protein n=1 Tax=Polysphondylium violaceum TaxID=133409 RepID=A0A8J4UZX1_9MYCE|nr:hypothetical protein CYY_005052 [Polysphondylium violaceum]